MYEYLKASILLVLIITGVIKSLFFDLDYFLLATLMVLACIVYTGEYFPPSNLINSSMEKEE